MQKFYKAEAFRVVVTSLKIHSDLANILCCWLKKQQQKTKNLKKTKNIQNFSLFFLNRGHNEPFLIYFRQPDTSTS